MPSLVWLRWRDAACLPRLQTLQVVATGEGAASVTSDASNLIVRATQLVFDTFGKTMPPLKFVCHNGIPFGAGMGSSSAAIAAGIAVGYALLGHTPDDAGSEEFLQLAAKLEGHVDNIAPCIYGGCRLGFHADGRWRTVPVPVPAGLQAVVFVPTAPEASGVSGEGTKTEAARAILPPAVSRADAVFNISRASLLVHAFATGKLDELKYATQDALHQALGQSVFERNDNFDA